MNELPLVTIVTPSYNQAPFLEATIRSVLEQGYPRIEYIVNDGGSNDGSVEIIKRYADRLGSWVSEKDAGQSDAINKGWRRANGEIVAWLNSDDTYLPGAIRAATEFMTAHPEVGLVYSDCPLVDANDKRIGMLKAEPFALKTLLFSNYIPQSTVFVRRAVVERIGLLNPDFHYGMDYDYWMRAARYFQLAMMPGELATYRWHGEGKFLTRPDRMRAEYVQILNNAFQDPAFPDDLRPMRARAVGRCYLQWGLYSFTAGMIEVGKSSIAEAFAQDPTLGADKELIRDTLAYHIVNVLSSRTQMDDHSQREVGDWLDIVYANWARGARDVLPSRRNLLAHAALIQGFTAYQDKNLKGAGDALWQAVRQQPLYLSNRGVVSILLKSATRQGHA